MNNIVPFPGIANSWALMRQFGEIYFLCGRIRRQAERLMCGRGTSEEICLSIRLLQTWSERMEVLMVQIHEANEHELSKQMDKEGKL